MFLPLSFRWLIFPSILLPKSWKMHKLLKLIITLSMFEFTLQIRPQPLWVKSNANAEKCKQWCQQRFTNQLHVLGNKISYIAIMFQFVILLKFWGHLHVILLVWTGLELPKSSGCLLATRCRFVVTSWNNLNDSAHSMARSIRFDCLKISETEVGINLYR